MSYGVAAPERLGRTKIPDGRMLGWAEWGPEDGMPVLFFSGAGLSRWLGFGADVVEQHGVRLISVERPGLGTSDPAPTRTLGDWAEDMRCFAEARQLPAFAVVGFSQGAPFALACAAAGIASAAAVVSGQDELAHPAFADALHPDIVKMLHAAAADPTAFESSFSQSANAEMLWHLIVSMSSDVDRRVYTEPAFADHFRRALGEGFSQGAAGYARDLLLSMGRWPFDPATINAPVELWYGGQDTSLVHSPDQCAFLARRLPASRRHLLPDAGGSLLWTHASDILAALVQARRALQKLPDGR
jgi:pimeloyl-ACP methyl ester carboxylesterase